MRCAATLVVFLKQSTDKMKFLQKFLQGIFSGFFLNDFMIFGSRVNVFDFITQRVPAIFPGCGGGMPLEVVASSGEIVALAVAVDSCAAMFCFVEWIGLLESWRKYLRHREFRFLNRCMSGWRSFVGACGV
jgi:hypothetical protein